jgi:phenylpyruvate tautomerase PptA (4-oxalocrotonate tautomerase family)
MARPEGVPLIQLDVQPLNPEQRAELRSRVVAAVSKAIGSPSAYVSVVIRESEPANLVEAGGWGPYDRRQPVPAAEPRVDPGGRSAQPRP